MSDITEHSHLPRDGRVRPLGYYLGVNFFPELRLTHKLGYEFAATLSDFFDLSKTTIGEHSWSFVSEKGNFTVQVGKRQFELHGESPTDRQEVYEERYTTVLSRFHEKFAPEWIMASKAMLRGLVSIDGDARLFLAGHVMNLDPKRLMTLQRMLSVIGLRIGFHRDEDGAGNPDWDIDVRVESWVPDPRQLYVEADATWQHDPIGWSDSSQSEVVGRLATLTEYVDNQIVPFLTHKSEED